MNNLNENKIGHLFGLIFGSKEQSPSESSVVDMNDLYRRVVENVNEGVWVIDKNYKTIFVNKSLLEILGYREKEMIGHKAEDFVVSKEIVDHNRELKERTKGKISYYERSFRKKDGSVVLCRVSAVPIMNRKKQFDGSIGVVTDITEQKKIENQLQMSEEKFATAFQVCPDLMSITRMSDGVILDVNESYTKMLGYSHEESVGKSTKDLSIWFDLADRERFVSLLKKNGFVNDFEITLRRKDGTTVPVLDSAKVFRFQDQDCILSIAHDISNRKQAEMYIYENEERYRKLISEIKTAIVVHGPDTKILISNSMAQDLLGLDKEQMFGRKAIDPAWHFFKEDGSLADVNEFPVNLVLKTKQPIKDYILRVHRSDKLPDVWALVNGTPVFDKNNNIEQVIINFVDITDRKKAELEREQFYKFFDLSTDIMVIADPNGAFKKVNKTCLDILGYTETELISKPFVDFILKDDKQSTLDEMARQIKVGESINFENRYVCKNGNILWLSWRAKYDKKEGITYATARDITERKIAEVALKNKNRALKMVSEINQALIHINDEKELLDTACRICVQVGGYILSWVGFAQTDKTKTVLPVSFFGSGLDYVKNIKVTWSDTDFGRGPTGLSIRTGQTQISRDIANDPKMLPWRKAALGYGFRSSIALPLKDGGHMLGALTMYSSETNAFGEEEVKILEELAGDLAFGIMTHRNRMEQKKMADLIEKNQKALVEAQRIGHFGSWEWDAVSDKITWSKEYYRLIGFDPKKDPPGYKDHLKIYTTESAARLDEAVKKNMKTGESYSLDLEIAKPKSDCKWLTARSETIYDNNGKIIGLRGTAQDITERKLNDQRLLLIANDLENALTESKKLSAIVENTFEAVSLVDLGKSNQILYVNKAWEEMFGYKKSEVINKKSTILDFFKNDEKIEKKFWECIKKGELFSSQIEMNKKNGDKFFADINTIPLFDKSGKVYVWCNTIRDITEAKAVDQMKTEFVSLASHQLRTPLTGVKWFTELLSKDAKKTMNQDQLELLSGIASSNDRAINLVDELLNVSRLDARKKLNIKFSSVNIVSLINDIIVGKEKLAQEKKVVVSLDDKAPKNLVLRVDKDKIQQVFDNLIDNSLKYSKPNTQVKVSIKTDANQVVFSVKDQGIGIPVKKREKIFTKFFRADNAASVDNTGSGLGLYIAKGIVEYHDGKIWFDSVEGKGSTFYFSLPIK